jgi:hypothetical protein
MPRAGGVPWVKEPDPQNFREQVKWMVWREGVTRAEGIWNPHTLNIKEIDYAILK